MENKNSGNTLGFFETIDIVILYEDIVTKIEVDWSLFNKNAPQYKNLSAHDLAREFYRSQHPDIAERAKALSEDEKKILYYQLQHQLNFEFHLQLHQLNNLLSLTNNLQKYLALSYLF